MDETKAKNKIKKLAMKLFEESYRQGFIDGMASCRKNKKLDAAMKQV